MRGRTSNQPGCNDVLFLSCLATSGVEPIRSSPCPPTCWMVCARMTVCDPGRGLFAVLSIFVGVQHRDCVCHSTLRVYVSCACRSGGEQPPTCLPTPFSHLNTALRYLCELHTNAAYAGSNFGELGLPNKCKDSRARRTDSLRHALSLRGQGIQVSVGLRLRRAQLHCVCMKVHRKCAYRASPPGQVLERGQSFHATPVCSCHLNLC